MKQSINDHNRLVSNRMLQLRRLFAFLVCCCVLPIYGQTPAREAPLTYMELPVKYRVHPQLITPVGDAVMRGAPPTTEQSQFDIKGFRLLGLQNIIDSARLSPLLQAYVGQSREQKTVLLAAASVANALRNYGFFLAEAVVPEQNFYNGIFTIVVRIGRVSDIRVEWTPNRPPDQHVIDQLLGDITPGAVISEAMTRHIKTLIFDQTGRQAKTEFAVTDFPGGSQLVIRII